MALRGGTAFEGSTAAPCKCNGFQVSNDDSAILPVRSGTAYKYSSKTNHLDLRILSYDIGALSRHDTVSWRDSVERVA